MLCADLRPPVRLLRPGPDREPAAVQDLRQVDAVRREGLQRVRRTHKELAPLEDSGDHPHVRRGPCVEHPHLRHVDRRLDFAPGFVQEGEWSGSPGSLAKESLSRGQRSFEAQDHGALAAPPGMQLQQQERPRKQLDAVSDGVSRVYCLYELQKVGGSNPLAA